MKSVTIFLLLDNQTNLVQDGFDAIIRSVKANHEVTVNEKPSSIFVNIDFDG